MLFRYLILLLLSIGYCFKSEATHIVGGEMSYKYLGNNIYEITLHMFRDCGPDNTLGTDFDNSAAIGIYQGTNLYNSFGTSLDNVTLVDFAVNNPCLVIPDNLCIQQGEYVFNVELPPNEIGYHISYQRCCRNFSVQNVADAAATGMTVTVFIPGGNLFGNSSPQFESFPPFTMCINESMRLTYAATDPDGDDVVYSFYTPFLGADNVNPVANPPTPPPYSEILWKEGYSEEYPIDGEPTLSIDPSTGEISVTPTKPGKFAMGLAVDEYRNGVFVSRVIRDFYLTVTDCPPVTAIIDSVPPCVGLNVNITNSSNGGYEYIWSFPEDNPSAKRFGPVINYKFSEKGENLVKLLIRSKTGCQDSTTRTIEIYPALFPEIEIADTVCVGYELNDITLGGAYEDYVDVFWDFGEGVSPRYSEDLTVSGVVFNTIGTQKIIVLTDQDVCHSFDSTFVEVIQTPTPLFEIDADTGCVPFIFNINDLSNITGPVNYYWDMGNGDVLSNVDSGYTYQTPGEFVPSLTLEFSKGCSASFEYSLPTTIKVYDLLQVNYEVPDIECLEGNSFDLVPVGNHTTTAKFNWYTPNAIGDSLHHADTINNLSYLAAGMHKVTLDVVNHYCESTYTNWVEVQNNPNARFTITDDVLCVENEIHFLNQSTADTELSYAWYFGEKDAYSVEENPTYVYRNVKDYHVELMVYTSEGCIDTAIFVLDSNITVYPLPDPNFEIADRALDITNPVSSITNWSDSAVFGYYRVHPTNDIIDGLEEHTYEFEPGKHEVWQVVTNKYGCVDSTKRIIEVLGHTVYAPNAFTPNNDGVNDGFRAYVRGAVAYTIMVLDRWGNVVFSTTDQEEVWRGILPNGNQAKSDVYSYRIELQEIKGVWHKYIGRVTLVR